mgnify:CR=1 FL=1
MFLYRVESIWWRFAASVAGQTLGVLVAVTSVMLSAIHPLTFSLMPVTPDGLLHLYRLVALDHAIQHGDWWPRYVPGLLFGYGAPVFNYYAPLSLYIPEILHLVGLRYLDALLIGMIVWAMFGAFGAYLLGRLWGREAGGMVTAAAYAYAPYVLYDWPRRGAVAEFAALALLPWLGWAFWRLAMRGQRRDLIASTLCLAALILTHNITALVVMPLLFAYGAYLWWTSPDSPRAFVRLGLAILLALGLTTFFWLPALAESRYVHIDRVSYSVANLDFHNNFQPLNETFALPLTADLTQLHPPVPRPLGWPHIALALAGVGMLVWQHRQRPAETAWLRGWLALAGGMIVTLLFLTTRASTWIWELVPLMHFIQFPWRLLGPLSLLLAALAGIGAAKLMRHIPIRAGQVAWIGLCVGLMIIYALPWLYGAYLPDPPAQGIVDAQNFERQTGWVAATAAGEYVPIWTSELPDMDRLLGLYAQGDVIPRLQPAPSVTIESAVWKTMGAVLTFHARAPATLVFDWLYFPGWWARLDGEPVRIILIGPQAFVGVEVPQGEHRLEIGFGPTPLRLGAMITSGVFTAALIASLILPRRLWSSPPQPDEALRPNPWPIFLTVTLAGWLFFGMKVLWIDGAQTIFKRARFASGIEAGVQTPVLAAFDHQITLLGYDLTPRQVASGRPARLALYWQLAGPEVDSDYSSVVYLRDPAGNVLLQTGSQHPGDLPTSDWIAGFYVQERLVLIPPAGTPPGSYPIHAALYSHEAQRNLDAFDAAGNPVGVTAQIGVLEVRRPTRPVRPDALGLATILNARLTDDLMLLGSEELPTTIEVGQPFLLVWGWRAMASPIQAYDAQIIWLDEAGQVAAVSPPRPPTTDYPTNQWQRHDVWRGIHLLTVPGRLSAGRYSVAVQLLDASGQAVGERVTLGQIEVTTPPRIFAAPDPAIDTDVVWSNGIRLLGYDLADRRLLPGEAVDLTLYWQPQDDLTASLTVFAHLVAEDGSIAAQQDQIPALGARPTTGWAPGEVIADRILVFLAPGISPGQYRLRIGWYQALNGERSPLPDGSDSWLLPDVITVRP